MKTAPPDTPSGPALPWTTLAAPPAAAAACVLSRRAMRDLDAATIAAGTPALELMERAGTAIADALTRPARLGLSRAGGVAQTAAPGLLVLAGAGNNGGDGFVVARLLAQKGWRCSVALCAAEPRAGGEAAANLARWRAGGGLVIDLASARDAIGAATPLFDFVLDALLGTGLDRPVDESMGDLIHHLNCRAGSARRSVVVAVDVPSGLCADSGRPLGCAVRAAATVALGAYKPGLFVGDGPDYCGRLAVADIGLLAPSEAGLQPVALALDRRSTAGALAAPRPMAHKGSRGHVLIVAGARGKSGAAALAARAALRAGAGLVTVALPLSQQPILAASLIEAMTAPLLEDETGALAVGCAAQLKDLIEKADSVVFGPGVGTGEGAAAALRAVLATARCPVVLDADGLNLLALLGSPGRLLLADRAAYGMGAVILTPHPGEMARLRAVSTAEVQASRLELALNLAKTHGCVVVLKGAGTIVTDGQRTAFNTSGNAGMAAAGMGDVLAGVIGALAARCPDAVEAACLGVYAHGVAGDACARVRGLRKAPSEAVSGDSETPGGQGSVVSLALASGFLAGEVADAVPSALAGISTW